MGSDRKRAIALKAADARELIKNSLPMALKNMSQAQIAQVQRVLDAAVVNPEVQKEYGELRRKATKVYGELVVRDEQIMRRANRVGQQLIPITFADKRVKLDHNLLLDADAFKPVTDNPDEARYLAKVKDTIEQRGIWLRFEQKLVRDPEDPSRWMIDQRTFQVWLSVGSEGDAIPTDTGLVNRKALLGTQFIGAGYYDEVHRGPVERALERETNRLIIEIDSGIDQHNMIDKIRRDAFVGVTEISDLLGGADFPDRKIWDYPRNMVHMSMQLNVGGNVLASQAYLVVAAIATRNCAKLMAEYLDDSSSGVERAVKILKVAKAAGEVAEVGLGVTTGAGIVRAGAKVIGTEVAAKTAKDKAVDAAAEKLVSRMVTKDPSLASDLSKVRWVPGPKGSVSGRGLKPGQSTGHGEGFHKFP